MSKTWRCAIVGVGTVGDWHVRVIPQVPGAQLVAVCDILPENARKSLEKHKQSHVPIYSDQMEMLKKEKIDIVHVWTPSGDHMGPAIKAMEAGKNVITEKPMEIHLDRIDAMIAAAKKNGVKLAGIFQNRWSDSN